MPHCNSLSQFWGINPKAMRGGQTDADNIFSRAAVFPGEEVCEEFHLWSCCEDLNLEQEMKLLLQTHIREDNLCCLWLQGRSYRWKRGNK